MKNLKDLFETYKLCPLCGSKGKTLDVFYSNYPQKHFKYKITKNYLTLFFDGSDQFGIKIDLNSNAVEFGEDSFGRLAGGDYLFKLACEDCHSFQYEAYCFYLHKEQKLQAPELLGESILIFTKEGDMDVSYNYSVNCMPSNAILSTNTSTKDGFDTKTVVLSMRRIFDLPCYSKEKLISKFKTMILLA
jgi:hypothetical protein